MDICCLENIMLAMRVPDLDGAGLEEVQLTCRVRLRMHHGRLAEFEQDVVDAQLAGQLRIQLHRDHSLRNGVATHAKIICADRRCARGPRRAESGVPESGATEVRPSDSRPPRRPGHHTPSYAFCRTAISSLRMASID